MKTSLFILAVCLYNINGVKSATTPSTTITTTVATTSPTNTQTTTAIVTVTTTQPTTTNDITSPTVVTQAPTTSTIATSTTRNGTVSSTTLSTTTDSIVTCRNGSCDGNDTSCINDLVDTCILTGTMQCYQIVQTNGTEMTYYEVGCTDNCEFLEETTDDITRVTRCCDTLLCTDELLEDQQSTASTRFSCWITVILSFYSVILGLYT